QETHYRCRSTGKLAQRQTVATMDRDWAGNSLCSKMIHQPEEEWQVAWQNALFVQREEVGVPIGLYEIVRVLHPLCDAFAGHDAADVILRNKGSEFLIGDFRINRHDSRARQVSSARGSLKRT